MTCIVPDCESVAERLNGGDLCDACHAFLVGEDLEGPSAMKEWVRQWNRRAAIHVLQEIFEETLA